MINDFKRFTKLTLVLQLVLSVDVVYISCQLALGSTAIESIVIGITLGK